MNRGKKLETEDMYNGIERYASTVTHQPLRIIMCQLYHIGR